MTSLKLVLLRVLAHGLGRLPGGSRLLRRLLLTALKKKGRMSYVAHAGFYDLSQTLPDGAAAQPLFPFQMERHD